MKMKNFFLTLFLLAIAGLWTGCSNNDEITNASSANQAISFRVQGGMPALRATGTTLPFVNAFVVYGSDNLAASNIFSGVTVARQAGSGDLFDYSPKKYYTENATSARFAAYSPVSTKISNASFAYSTGFSFNYAVPVPDPTGNTSQEDLLVAGTTVAPSPASVSLAFQHALSRIFVKATSDLSETVTIKRLILRNLYSAGTIQGLPGAPWSWGWTPTGARTASYEYVLAHSGVAVEANQTTPILVTSMEQGMMILPQLVVNAANDVTQGDFALEIVYDVANILNQTTYVYLANNYAFVKGTQYAITVAFHSASTNLIEINFTISVGDFADDPLTMP